MGYVICEKCGGYYELEEGESPEDFAACNCGGTLSYVESIQKERTKPKNVIKCNICGHEQEKRLICSKCGSRIRVNPHYSNNFKTNPPKGHDYRQVLTENSSINFFEKINWNGVTSGIVFYIVASIIIRIVGGIFLGGSIFAAQNANIATISPIMWVITLIFGFISAIIPLASGFWAVSTITTRDYTTGILTGGMVGVIMGILFGILSLTAGLLLSGFYGQINVGVEITSGLMVLIMGMIYGGAMTAAGGLMAVYVRRHTSYLK